MKIKVGFFFHVSEAGLHHGPPQSTKTKPICSHLSRSVLCCQLSPGVGLWAGEETGGPTEKPHSHTQTPHRTGPPGVQTLPAAGRRR